MQSFFLIICILWAASGMAYEPRDRAISFYAIKDYQKAREIYEGIMVNPVPAWQKAFLLYNIGTTYMAEGKWIEARTAFDSVTLGEDPSPLLVRYLKTNLGVDTLRQAYELTLTPSYDVDKAIWLLHNSLKNFEEAYQAECAMEALDSTNLSGCLQPHDLSEMKKIADQLLFEVNQTKRSHLMQSLKRVELLYLLIEEVNQVINFTSFLKRSDIPPEKKAAYSTLFYEHAQAQMPLWDKIDISIKDSFVQGLAALNQGNIEKSSLAFENALRLLKELEENEAQENTEQQRLEKLLFRYKLTLAEDPLDSSSIESLHEDQQKQFPESSANALLQNVLRLINSKQNAAGRFFLQGALGEISFSKVKADMSPESILKNLINDQNHALSMNTLYLQISKPDASAANLLREVQKRPLNGASAFIESSLAEQRITYLNESQCLWYLWGTVFPLFEEGFSLATQAYTLLEKSPPEAIGAHPLQDRAIKKWEEALNELRRQKNEKKESQNTAEPIPPAMQNTINSIEEMDLQDAIPKPRRPVKTGEGIPPW